MTRKPLQAAIYLLFLALVVELTFQIFHVLRQRAIYRPALLAEEYSGDLKPVRRAGGDVEVFERFHLVQHPFLGFVQDDLTVTRSLLAGTGAAPRIPLLSALTVPPRAEVTRTERGLTLRADRRPPFLTVDGHRIDRPGLHLVQVTLEAPADTVASLAWAPEGEDFLDADQVLRRVSQGHNELAFVLETDGSRRLELRFQPGREDGTYRIAAASISSFEPEVADRLRLEQTFGFPLNRPTGTEPISPPPLRVLLTGGSVAAHQGYYGHLEQALADRLRAAAPGRSAELFTAALGGYKQPQQLIALELLISHGRVFDIVINLDGFNEIVLPWFDNVRYGVAGLYPRNWDALLGAQTSDSALQALGEAVVLQRRKLELVRALHESPLYRSAVAGFVAAARLRRLSSRIIELGSRVAAANPAEFVLSGPLTRFDRSAVLADAVEAWSRASVTMDAVAARWGAEYFHVLQPNQYVAGSKPFTAEEREKFLVLDRGYGPLAAQGYPRLIERGRELAREGIRFIDATGLFATETRTIYADACCHYNATGNRMLAELVADEVAKRSEHFRRP